MRKYLIFIISLIAAPCLFVACDDPHDPWDDGYDGYWGGNDYYDDLYSGSLNSYEQSLVGSYVSDGDGAVTYIVLNQDRTGSLTTSGKAETFQWRATANKVYALYTGENQETEMDYYYTTDHLVIDNVPLVTNNGQTSTDLIVGQWEGVITDYYANEYSSDTYLGKNKTIFEFASDNTGAQIDYKDDDINQTFSSYVFEWSKASDGAYTLYFDNDTKPITIKAGNVLTSTSFTGQMAIGDTIYSFRLTKTSGFDWTNYLTTGGAAKMRGVMGKSVKGFAAHRGGFAAYKVGAQAAATRKR